MLTVVGRSGGYDTVNVIAGLCVCVFVFDVIYWAICKY